MAVLRNRFFFLCPARRLFRLPRLRRFPHAETDPRQTWATCVIFILNMVLHPEVQIKAQALVDSVVGSGRLPDFNDRPQLPYIDFIINEVFR